jgi:hypothetical protein
MLTFYTNCSVGVKRIISAATLVSSIGVLFAAAAWAGDTRYQTLELQKLYVEQVAANDKATEVRRLQQEIFALELKDTNGTATPEDRAMSQYLQRDLEELQGP